MLKLIALLFFFIPTISFSQNPGKLSVEKIMRDAKWIGTSPSEPFWNADGDRIYFKWNPDKAPSDSLYFITVQNSIPVKATMMEKQDVVRAESIRYNLKRTAFVYSKDGDIFYQIMKPKKTYRITQTEQSEYNPQFSFNEKQIVYNRDRNLFAFNITTGETRQLTNFLPGKKVEKDDNLSKEDQWLKNDQVKYLRVLKERKEKKRLANLYDSFSQRKELRKIYLEDKQLRALMISPDGRFISYQLTKFSERRATIVPDYVTETGYTTDIPGREKVGQPQESSSFFIYDRELDSIFEIKTDSINGIRDVPEFFADYPSELAKKKKENALRKVDVYAAIWSPIGSHLVIDISSQDHKDRWLMLWDTASRKLKLLDRQHDSAWIGGPGMGNRGWIDENEFWYQSEVTGYSHLYSLNVVTGIKKPITNGSYEILDATLSHDKKYFYVSTNEVEPAQHQFYRLRISDGKKERITTMTGANEVTISPDEKSIAVLYSYSNKPWELYVQENKPGGKMKQITYKAESEEFKSYPWRDPQIVTFKVSDGAVVHARLYQPATPDVHKPAVIFVHGAGYLQNAHKWWSYYFREFMFNNMLADNGYYVLDIDYRGSAGYGRNWRTAIYRHMGGKDLSDQVDGVNYLVKTFGVNPKNIGIYGGSYGGFITLMGMFTTPDVFAAGAGIRSVTDWANYNHEYTSEILNEPYNDSLAYQRSSPVYFAEGLKGHLLMLHGMVDGNVHFQDIVKVSQRLIELGKDNWELAVYPMEDHAFVEPSSWTDEYKRIFKLFENVLKK
jgi:dipeptidyl aminopeptidase/acylaminoacyl peptidase